MNPKTTGGKASLLILLGSALIGGPAAARTLDPGRIKPREIQVGPEAGLLESHFTASSEYRSLITPTESRGDFQTTPAWGLSVSARWSHWFSLTVSPRFETYGTESREQTVAFPGNPFPHTMQSRTEMSYIVWPVMAGMGWEGSRQHLRVQLGVYKAFLDEGEVQWKVDGEPYSGGMPSVTYQEDFSGWLVGIQYGFRMGPGEWVAGAESQRGFETLMTGLEGSIKARSTRLRMSYLWTVFRK